MARSLWFKLMAAFSLVITVGMALVVILVSQTAAGEFALYVTRSGQQMAARIVPNLEAYYARTGSWNGVEAVLADPWTAQSQTMGDMMGGQHGPMMGGSAGLWAMFGSRAILAASDGVVVADSGAELVGTALDQAALAQGAPVVAAGRVAGTLLVVPDTAPATPAGEFLGAVNRAALLAGLVTAALALLVSGYLFFQIARPLQHLAAAAQGIAAGNLDARAPVQSRDEVGRVAVRFNEMATQLQRYAVERKHMIADIAHELRTPLAVIQSNLEAMLDGLLPASPVELAALHQEVLLLNRLIGDLRILSLAEMGQLQLDLRPAAPGDLARDVMERLAPIAAAKGTSIAVEVSEALPLVQADRQRLSQALANLVDNAVRYSPPGSQVIVGARLAGPKVEFTVSDNGPGIPPEDLPHVFERFWRGERSRNRATGGSGLGLAIVKQLVEAQGGCTRVESPIHTSSTSAGGTRFVITMAASHPR